MKAYLHIGFYKCGSTFLQTHIFPALNNEFLLKGDPSFHIIENVIEKLLLGQETVSNGRKIVDEIITKSSSEALYLSSELLAGYQANCYFDIEKRFEIFEQLFRQPNYILIIRKQDMILQSSWHEAAKKGMIEGFNEFVGDAHTDMGQLFHRKGSTRKSKTSYKCYDYVRLLTPFLETPERVTILPLEMLQEKPDAFYRSLCRGLDLSSEIDDTKTGMFVETQKYKKTRASRKEDLYLFCLNKYVKGSQRIVDILFKIYIVLSGNKRQLERYDNPITTYFLATIGWLVFKMLRSFMVRKNDLPNKDKLDEILDYHMLSNSELSKLIDIDLSAYGYFDNRITREN